MRYSSCTFAAWVTGMLLVGCGVGRHEQGTFAPPTTISRGTSHLSASVVAPPLDSPSPAVARTVDGSNETQLSPPSQSQFSPWLRTPGAIGLFPVQSALAVIVYERDPAFVDSGYTGYTIAPGYILTDKSLREEPRLFEGLPQDESGVKPNIPGLRVNGSITITGQWPQCGTLTSTPNRTGCWGCFPTEYEWHGKRWVQRNERKVLVTAEPRDDDNPITFPNGTALWERFVYATEELNSPGESTFFLDPQHKKRAYRQRAQAPKGCQGGTRVLGPFKGVPLSDGGLLGIGQDCQTGVISAEFWAGGATTSRIMELPGAPKGEIVSHGALRAADSLRLHIRSPNDIVLGFEWSESGARGGRAYVSVFNGKNWQDLSPRPPLFGFWEVQRQPDGGLWLHTGDGHWLRRADDGTFADEWVTVCPSVHGADGRPPTVVFDPAKRPWLFGGDSIIEYAEGTCIEHRLPAFSPSPMGDSCYVTNLQFLPNGNPVAVRFCGRSGSGESTLLLERKTETVIVR